MTPEFSPPKKKHHTSQIRVRRKNPQKKHSERRKQRWTQRQQHIACPARQEQISLGQQRGCRDPHRNEQMSP